MFSFPGKRRQWNWQKLLWLSSKNIFLEGMETFDKKDTNSPFMYLSFSGRSIPYFSYKASTLLLLSLSALSSEEYIHVGLFWRFLADPTLLVDGVKNQFLYLNWKSESIFWGWYAATQTLVYELQPHNQPHGESSETKSKRMGAIQFCCHVPQCAIAGHAPPKCFAQQKQPRRQILVYAVLQSFKLLGVQCCPQWPFHPWIGMQGSCTGGFASVQHVSIGPGFVSGIQGRTNVPLLSVFLFFISDSEWRSFFFVCDRESLTQGSAKMSLVFVCYSVPWSLVQSSSQESLIFVCDCEPLAESSAKMSLVFICDSVPWLLTEGSPQKSFLFLSHCESRQITALFFICDCEPLVFVSYCEPWLLRQSSDQESLVFICDCEPLTERSAKMSLVFICDREALLLICDGVPRTQIVAQVAFVVEAVFILRVESSCYVAFGDAVRNIVAGLGTGDNLSSTNCV